MKERIQPHYPTASEAAAEEKRLQLELALQFDAHEYRVGDQVTWLVPHDYVEGKGELVVIGDAIEIIEGDRQNPIRWKGSLHINLKITESHIKQPKHANPSHADELTQLVAENYTPGKCIELRKSQVTGGIRRRVAWQ